MDEKQTQPKSLIVPDRPAEQVRTIPPPPTWQEMIEPERDPRYDPFRRLRH